MTAEEYFNNQVSTDVNQSVVDKYKRDYDVCELLKFAESYASIKQNELIEKAVIEMAKSFDNPLCQLEYLPDEFRKWLKSLKSE